jgi:hypothetical protein
MDRPWKVLVVCMLIFQCVLTYVMLDLHDYAVWLHFSDACRDGSCARGLWDTAPGGRTLLALGITGVPLAIIAISSFWKHGTPAKP